MLQETLTKFGYPDTLIKEYQNWWLLRRYEQVTLGSLILINKQEVKAFSNISKESFIELTTIIPEIETKLKAAFNYDKINYLMLMMKDPEVHFHIIPRFSKNIEFEGVTFKDISWGSAPKLDEINEADETVLDKITEKLKEVFNI